MTAARRILIVVAWLFVLGVVVQFFLAGLGSLGGESWDAHRGFGFSALFLTPVFILVLAYLAKVPRVTLGMAVALVVASLAQPFWASEFEGEALGAVHVLGALVIFVLAHHVAQRTTREHRGASE